MDKEEIRRGKVRLGDLLIDAGLLNDIQLQRALQEQKRTGFKLGRTVIDLGFVDEQRLLTALSEQLKISFIELKNFKFDKALVQMLPETLARRFRVIVLSKAADGLVVGMSDPLDLFALDEMERVLRTPVQPAVVREAEMLKALDALYRRTSELDTIAGELEGDLKDSDFDLSALGATNNSDAPVVRLLRTLFEDAVQMNASDIHIEPGDGILRIRQRIDGVLNEHILKEPRVASALVMRLKIMSGLDISEKRIPQDGRFNIRVKERTIDIRMSTMPVQHGESVVMRLLDQTNGITDLDKGGMPTAMLARFRQLLQRPFGLVLVTGPTGSGKTTTLYAGLSELNSPQKKIITVEDPVEYRLARVNQVQVNTKIDLTFSRVLRAALRQDPDILLIGEIRDHETAEIGLRAAMTGHLVLSTLHTNDAPTTAMRLIDMGVEPFLVATALSAVLAQRLIRRVCESCRAVHVPEPHQLTWMENLYGGSLRGQLFYQGVGCHNCHSTGYLGRLGVYELLEMNDEMVGALRRNDPQGFADAALASPLYRPLATCALDFAMKGLTSVEEVLKVSISRTDEVLV
ncbi:GspE/PulE family protein [Pseudomonas sp. 10B1]|uniref:GspE/PulE family protein n=1 Tax=unclassified Pseudomonas TaxID=196821 RepID=UPI002AB40193|nr:MULTISPECIES: GspE/PulE family protein [unclassified Pseudomonas]MDY7559194.1 GspE/PulE family protein [Pseudomonas sp. AB6]MEA9978749.1 GspE/PulE family protein [Pseudomonas sp. RTS4]MEA9994212.1 GspE/PulE family protein [Pseudomonas sp. AA4]MEB0086153.1 GspE/PulE family protein [Pseudomonas sp. RTI1]MEB0124941.1 GspE/PulE family protein [Pseudomonas sp. CCC1.2]